MQSIVPGQPPSLGTTSIQQDSDSGTQLSPPLFTNYPQLFMNTSESTDGFIYHIHFLFILRPGLTLSTLALVRLELCVGHTGLFSCPIFLRARVTEGVCHNPQWTPGLAKTNVPMALRSESWQGVEGPNNILQICQDLHSPVLSRL